MLFVGGYVLLTFTALYQIWTPPGYSVIQGLQGRYFIPSGPFALMSIVPNRNILQKQFCVTVVIIGIILFLGYVTQFLARSYGFVII